MFSDESRSKRKRNSILHLRKNEIRNAITTNCKLIDNGYERERFFMLQSISKIQFAMRHELNKYGERFEETSAIHSLHVSLKWKYICKEGLKLK